MKRILVVEDDPIIALDLAGQLAEAGYAIVGPASNVARALALVNDEGCDIAILDVNLGRGATSEPIAVELTKRSIPFITLSGYSNDQNPAVFKSGAQQSKPVDVADLVPVIEKLLCRSGSPPARK